jgi:hypothetical protein
MHQMSQKPEKEKPAVCHPIQYLALNFRIASGA